MSPRSVHLGTDGWLEQEGVLQEAGQTREQLEEHRLEAARLLRRGKLTQAEVARLQAGELGAHGAAVLVEPFQAQASVNQRVEELVEGE